MRLTRPFQLSYEQSDVDIINLNGPQQQTYDRLIEMGFGESDSLIAALVCGSNIARAIHCITSGNLVNVNQTTNHKDQMFPTYHDPGRYWNISRSQSFSSLALKSINSNSHYDEKNDEFDNHKSFASHHNHHQNLSFSWSMNDKMMMDENYDEINGNINDKPTQSEEQSEAALIGPQQQTYDTLIGLGCAQTDSLIAAQVCGSSVTGAANWIRRRNSSLSISSQCRRNSLVSQNSQEFDQMNMCAMKSMNHDDEKNDEFDNHQHGHYQNLSFSWGSMNDQMISMMDENYDEIKDEFKQVQLPNVDNQVNEPTINLPNAILKDGEYQIISSHSDKALDVQWGRKDFRARFIQWKPMDAANQTFILERQPCGSYTVRCKHTEFYWEAKQMNDGNNRCQLTRSRLRAALPFNIGFGCIEVDSNGDKLYCISETLNGKLLNADGNRFHFVPKSVHDFTAKQLFYCRPVGDDNQSH